MFVYSKQIFTLLFVALGISACIPEYGIGVIEKMPPGFCDTGEGHTCDTGGSGVTDTDDSPDDTGGSGVTDTDDSGGGSNPDPEFICESTGGVLITVIVITTDDETGEQRTLLYYFCDDCSNMITATGDTDVCTEPNVQTAVTQCESQTGTSGTDWQAVQEACTTS